MGQPYVVKCSRIPQDRFEQTHSRKSRSRTNHHDPTNDEAPTLVGASHVRCWKDLGLFFAFFLFGLLLLLALGGALGGLHRALQVAQHAEVA